MPDYSTHDPKGWCGDPRRGAALGRATIQEGDAKTVTGNNHTLGIKLAKNGTAIDQTECRAFTGSGGQEAKLVTNWMISMAANDEVALFIANHSSNVDITFRRGRLVATQVPV